MRVFNTAAGILLIARAALGGAWGILPLSTLAPQADAIVVATVAGSSGSGPVTADLVVVRALKGSVTPGSAIAATWTAPAASFTTGANGELAGKTGIWFLKQSGAAWSVMPLAMGDIHADDIYLPVPAGGIAPAYSHEAGASATAKLAMEIGAAAADPATSAALDLSSMPAGVKTQLTRSLCEYRGADAASVQALGALAGSTATDMQTCAAHALREIHTKEALPYLVSLLDSGADQIRYDAVIGIAQYAMSFPVATSSAKPGAMATFQPGPGVTADMKRNYPAQGDFSKAEASYISYWKSWVAAHPAQ